MHCEAHQPENIAIVKDCDGSIMLLGCFSSALKLVGVDRKIYGPKYKYKPDFIENC